MQYSPALQDKLDRYSRATMLGRPVGVERTLRIRPLTEVVKLPGIGFTLHNMSLKVGGAADINLGDYDPNHSSWQIFNSLVM